MHSSTGPSSYSNRGDVRLQAQPLLPRVSGKDVLVNSLHYVGHRRRDTVLDSLRRLLLLASLLHAWPPNHAIPRRLPVLHGPRH